MRATAPVFLNLIFIDFSYLFLDVVMLWVGPVSVVAPLPHGKLLARSARVSLLHRGAFWRVFEVPPPHSLRMSVSWARELLLRLVAPVFGGELS